MLFRSFCLDINSPNLYKICCDQITTANAGECEAYLSSIPFLYDSNFIIGECWIYNGTNLCIDGICYDVTPSVGPCDDCCCEDPCNESTPSSNPDCYVQSTTIQPSCCKGASQLIRRNT